MDSTEITKILYDHYKETFLLNKEAQIRRNKNFVILCLLESLSFMMLIDPNEVVPSVLNSINATLNTSIIVSAYIVETFLWIMIAYVMMRYVQDVLYIERQYVYIDQLEKTIRGKVNNTIFSREGNSYKEDYPMVLNCIDVFYKMLSPILFVTINSVRIYKEWRVAELISLTLIVDTVLYISIITIVWMYFFETHPSISKWMRKHIPLASTIADCAKEILKKV